MFRELFETRYVLNMHLPKKKIYVLSELKRENNRFMHFHFSAAFYVRKIKARELFRMTLEGDYLAVVQGNAGTVHSTRTTITDNNVLNIK